MNTQRIEGLLAELGLHARRESRGDATTWRMLVQFERAPHAVALLFPTRRGSLLVVSKLASPRLRGRGLDSLPAEVLRAAVRLQSAALGASLVELGSGAYVACAVHRGPILTAAILKSLIVDVAHFGEQIDAALG